MREIKFTARFKKDLKRESKGRHRSTLERDLGRLLELLTADEQLPESYRDHALTGDLKDFRDCHVKPDLILIYQKAESGEVLILQLVRLGSHSELGI